MRTTLDLLRFTWLVTLIFTLGGCDGSTPTSPDMTMPPMGTMPGAASFQIDSAGQMESIAYGGTGNLVFCTRDAGWASLFIRFAEQREADGAAGPHLDLDLCAHQGGGNFSPKDPRSTTCSSEKTWDLFWHAADGTVYANQASSPDCDLQLTQNGDRLFGSFQCRDLIEDGGSRTLDVLNGSFDCTETS